MWSYLSIFLYIFQNQFVLQFIGTSLRLIGTLLYFIGNIGFNSVSFKIIWILIVQRHNNFKDITFYKFRFLPRIISAIFKQISHTWPKLICIPYIPKKEAIIGFLGLGSRLLTVILWLTLICRQLFHISEFWSTSTLQPFLKHAIPYRMKFLMPSCSVNPMPDLCIQNPLYCIFSIADSI